MRVSGAREKCAFPIYVSWEPDQSYHKRVLLLYSCNLSAVWLLTGGTVIPVSAVVPTVMVKSMFYGYLTVSPENLEWKTCNHDVIHCMNKTFTVFLLILSSAGINSI